MTARPALDTVIFDLGGVVLQWEPRRAFAEVLPETAIDGFMEQIDFTTWNRTNDAGRSLDVAEDELIRSFPDQSEAIRAYRRHFDRTLTGMVPGTNAILAELQQAGVRIVALTNWSSDLFPVARKHFGVLDRFEGIVVSGDEKLSKPDPAIFRLTCDRFGIDPTTAVFIDDTVHNCTAAEAEGLTAITFDDAATTRALLVDHGVLPAKAEAAAGPIFHVTERENLRQALESGHYPWSKRGVTYQAEGYVHCSRADQVQSVLRYFADLDPSDLVALELDPAELTGVVINEKVAPGLSFPHVFAPLDVEAFRDPRRHRSLADITE